ncbi:MAG: GPW/gp25 family protein [Myxococcota bacterium]
MSSEEENIRQSITLILGTRPGERQMMPEFGCKIHEVVFTPEGRGMERLVAYHVETALTRFEPRIEVLRVQAEAGEAGRLRVSVHYRVQSSQTESVLPLELETGG